MSENLRMPENKDICHASDCKISHKIFAIFLAIAIILIDQLNKIYLVELLHNNAGQIKIFSFFNLSMTWNKGVSFGMFSDFDAKWVLVAISILISITLLVWLLKEKDNRLTIYAFGMIIGGAIGNVIDRFRFGAVADFFDFHAMGYHWPAFNIADCAVVGGVAMLLLSAICFEKKNCSD